MVSSESGRTLTDVLDDLDDVIVNARDAHSPMGIFPAMYRCVTAEINEAVRAGFFDDNTRLERLAVIFADRYLDALQLWESGERPTSAWQVAFAAAEDGRRRTIAQHLFAGMNAHINLDLGIAAADVPGGQLDDMHADFLRVNDILFARLDGLQETLGLVSRRMALVDRVGLFLDERIMRMVIGNARDSAWELAVDLSTRPGDTGDIIAARDRETADLGATILGGNRVVRYVSRFVCRSEPRDATVAIDAFNGS